MENAVSMQWTILAADSDGSTSWRVRVTNRDGSKEEWTIRKNGDIPWLNVFLASPFEIEQVEP